MDKETIITKLAAHAEYLRKTRVPAGEIEVVERLNKCAMSLEKFAEELVKEDEADNQQGENV